MLESFGLPAWRVVLRAVGLVAGAALTGMIAHRVFLSFLWRRACGEGPGGD